MTKGERVFVAITVLQDQWWLRTQRHVTDPWTHTVVLQSRSPTCFWWAYKPEWPLWKTVCQSPQRLNIHFSYDPALSSLGVYPREMKTSGHTRTHTHTQPVCACLLQLSSESPTVGKQPGCFFSWEMEKQNCGSSPRGKKMQHTSDSTT